MPSFGEKLKQEREKRKMSLEQISATTKIGTRMLQALEEDKFNQLPGGIFNKGFVRAYSHCLGLDEDQTVAEYLEASGDAPPPRTEIPAREDEARENEEHLRRLEAAGNSSLQRVPWGWFAAFLLVIAILLSLWSRRQREHEKHLPACGPHNDRGAVAAIAGGGRIIQGWRRLRELVERHGCRRFCRDNRRIHSNEGQPQCRQPGDSRCFNHRFNYSRCSGRVYG